MPGAIVKCDELGDIPISIYQQMRRHLYPFQFSEICVLTAIELIVKQLLYVRTAKMTRGQADAMDNDQRYIAVYWSPILICGDPVCRICQQMIFDLH